MMFCNPALGGQEVVGFLIAVSYLDEAEYQDASLVLDLQADCRKSLKCTTNTLGGSDGNVCITGIARRRTANGVLPCSK